ncbi:hypothetical protein JAAARDRAFT_672732 [Jaapia argillacea MUCL 33604]|uniref:Uncharacterized protein n=1 Tax=Jaapia argillacea MUCL 33604 TaxID=933084 RepID=A0A067Q7J7_9AGAM|nr:hypothetical protein JAAARDRAFT_672732 [Jaapia argillacea MUCL 33604]
MGRLHELCPGLEQLCVGRNSKVTFKTIIPYLQKKAHARGTRMLELLDCRHDRATEEEIAFIQGAVDDYWDGCFDGWESRAWVMTFTRKT